MIAPQLTCTGVSKSYDRTPVLTNVNWTIESGATVALLGRSGAGKTTLLRLLAGLETCTTGHIEPVADGRAYRVGYVFQESALWPHLDVRHQLGCIVTGGVRTARDARMTAILNECAVPQAVWNHRPAQLSGGETQRVALARALAVDPQVLLLDEPLAQVDPTLRGELLELLARLARTRQLTVIYVTHTWAEASELCSRVAVLAEGRIAQEGLIDEVYWRPVDASVARLTGPMVEVPGDWLTRGLIRDARSIPADIASAAATSRPVVVRPQQLEVSTAEKSAAWTVVGCRPQGNGWQLRLASGCEVWSVAAARPAPNGTAIAVVLHGTPG